MINRTRLKLVPFVLSATAMVLFAFSGCREEGKGEASASSPAARPDPLSRMNDPAYREKMTSEAEVRKELLRLREGLKAKLEAAKAAGDAAEVKSLEGRIAEVNEAIDDVRRHMLTTIRSYMTNGTNRISK